MRIFQPTISGSLVITGSHTVSGSLFVSGAIESGGSKHIITYNTQSGLFSFTASSAIGSGGSGTGFPFSGSAVITGSLLVSQSGIIVTGSVSSTGGFTGSLFGTSSWAHTSSFALGLVYSTSSIIGDGINASYTITHNFNTRNLHVTVYENFTNYETVYPDIRRPSANSVQIVFANPVSATNQYVVYISQ